LLKGQYKFYKRGDLVAVSNNIITNAGKGQFIKYLAGATPQIGDTISVGVGSNTASVNDTRLNFEIESQEIDQIGYSTSDPKLVFKTSLRPGVAITISEVGLWAFKTSSSMGANSPRILSAADPDTETWIGATWDNTSRLSAESLLLSPAVNSIATANFSTFSQDLSSYSNADEFLIAYEAVSNISSMLIYFHTSDQDYYTGVIINSGTGYKIGFVLKNSFVATGSPNWADIKYLRIGARATTAGAGVAKFDALRVEKNTNLDSNTVLISRSRLVTPIVKNAAEPLDIEYTVKLNI